MIYVASLFYFSMMLLAPAAAPAPEKSPFKPTVTISSIAQSRKSMDNGAGRKVDEFTELYKMKMLLVSSQGRPKSN